jgi:cell division initiation protein
MAQYLRNRQKADWVSPIIQPTNLLKTCLFMKITPIEIRQHTFERGLRGYKQEEVDAFMVSLSQEWERVASENRMLRMQLEIAEKELGKLKEVEMTLFRTLKTAEDTSTQITEQATRAGDQYMTDTRRQADDVLAESRKKAAMLVQDAENQSRFLRESILGDVRAIEQDFKAMEKYKETLMNQIRTLASNAVDSVERFEKKFNKHAVPEKLNDVLVQVSPPNAPVAEPVLPALMPDPAAPVAEMPAPSMPEPMTAEPAAPAETAFIADPAAPEPVAELPAEVPVTMPEVAAYEPVVPNVADTLPTDPAPHEEPIYAAQEPVAPAPVAEYLIAPVPMAEATTDEMVPMAQTEPEPTEAPADTQNHVEEPASPEPDKPESGPAKAIRSFFDQF